MANNMSEDDSSEDLVQNTKIKFSDIAKGNSNISPVRKLKDSLQFKHTYSLRRLPPNGFTHFIKHKFKSNTVCTINKVKIDGVFQPSLTLMFSEYDDYVDASSFSCKIGGVDIKFDASEHESDAGIESLVVQPTVVKNMFLSNVPYDIVSNLESLADYLDPIAEINPAEMTLSLMNGVFDGRVAVPVVKYRVTPPKNYDIPLVDEMGCTINDACVTIRIFATGVPLGLEVMAEPERKKICYYCRQKGHEKSECPKLSDKNKGNHNGTRCKICGANDSGCSRKKCANFDSIKSGIIERHSLATGNSKPKAFKSPFNFQEGDSTSSYINKY